MHKLILSIFRQPVHVSGVSRPIIRSYNRMYTTIGTYYSSYMTVCCPSWIGSKKKEVPIIVYTRLHLLMMGLDTPETCTG